MSETRFICGHGDFPNPCPICQGASHNAVFDRLPVQPIAPQSSYSITPEGVTEAAKEIKNYVNMLLEPCESSIANVDKDLAAIILRHAAQSPEGMKTPWCLNGHEVLTPGCESCLLDLQKRYNDALRKVQGEGEMREALLAYEEAERHMRVGLCDTDCAKATKLLTAAHELAQKALGPAGREEKP